MIAIPAYFDKGFLQEYTGFKIFFAYFLSIAAATALLKNNGRKNVISLKTQPPRDVIEVLSSYTTFLKDNLNKGPTPVYHRHGTPQLLHQGFHKGKP